MSVIAVSKHDNQEYLDVLINEKRILVLGDPRKLEFQFSLFDATTVWVSFFVTFLVQVGMD